MPTNRPTPFCLCKPFSSQGCPGKRMEEQNPRLTTGSSAVCQQDRERSSFLAAGHCTDAYFVFVNPFHAKRVRELINPIVEPKSRTYHGRVAAGQTGTPTGRFAQNTIVPLTRWRINKTKVVDHYSEARTRQIAVKPMEEQNPRQTSGLSGGRGALCDPGCWLK